MRRARAAHASPRKRSYRADALFPAGATLVPLTPSGENCVQLFDPFPGCFVDSTTEPRLHFAGTVWFPGSLFLARSQCHEVQESDLFRNVRLHRRMHI